MYKMKINKERSKHRKGNGNMEKYTIRIANEEESDNIITLLKEVAQWLQHKRSGPVAVPFRRRSYG